MVGSFGWLRAELVQSSGSGVVVLIQPAAMRQSRCKEALERGAALPQSGLFSDGELRAGLAETPQFPAGGWGK